MARGDYAWYGDWMDDHYQPWIDLKKRTSDAWDAYMKASDHALNYLGGRTAGTQAEFEEAMRRYDASDAASARHRALTNEEAEMFSGAGKDKVIAAFDAWSNFKPESEPEPTKPDFPYSEPVESKDTGGGFIKNEDTGEVTNIGESKYHRIINEDGTGTIFPITESTGTTWSDFYQTEDEPIGDTMGEIAEQKPGQSPGDDRTKEPYDKDWPPPAPLKPKFDIADAGIPRTADWAGEGRPPAPESGMKWYPTNNPDDPGGGFWSPDLNHEKWKVENLGGEIGQIASSEGLQPGSLQDNIARDAKRQRLAQETGTQIRQLETDRRSSEPTLAERLAGLDQTIADNTYTTGDKIRDFFGDIKENWKENLQESRDAWTPTALEYGGNIIKSAFKGGDQVTRTEFSDQDVQRLFEDAYKRHSGNIPINPIEKPFSDEHMYSKDGVLTPHTAETREKYGNIAKDQAYYEGKGNPLMDALGKIQYGYQNPLAGRGKSSIQYVDSGDGKPTAVFSDAAYLKTDSKDPNDTTSFQGKIGGVVDRLSRIWGQSPQTELGKSKNIIGTEYAHSSLPYNRWSDTMKEQYTTIKNNKAMKGKSVGNVGGRKLYSIPSF